MPPEGSPAWVGMSLEDEQVFFSLVSAGARLGVPVKVEHYAYLPARAAAERTARSLRHDTFAVTVDRPAKGERHWLVQAVRSVPLRPAPVEGDIERVSAVARANGGYYDGWGAPVRH